MVFSWDKFVSKEPYTIYSIKDTTRFKLSVSDQVKNYKWKTDNDGNTLDEPVKFRDHLMDAMRYAIYTKFAKPKRGWVV